MRLGLLLLLPILALSCSSLGGDDETVSLPLRTVSGSAEATEADVALLEAVANNDATGLRSALERGARVDARDKDGRTALLIATYTNNAEIATTLVAAGADVN